MKNAHHRRNIRHLESYFSTHDRIVNTIQETSMTSNVENGPLTQILNGERDEEIRDARLQPGTVVEVHIVERAWRLAFHQEIIESAGV